MAFLSKKKKERKKERKKRKEKPLTYPEK